MIQLGIVLVFFIVMIVLGISTRKSTKSADSFFVANRNRSTPWIASSLVATIIGASATLGVAGNGFKMGLTAVWWLLAGTIGLIVLGLFLAKKVRKTGVYTLPGLIEKQYGNKVSMAASILIVISWLGVIAGQIIATGKIMAVLGIGDPVIWMIVFTFVIILYTVMGGQIADIKTNMVQTVLIFVGIFAGMAVLLHQVGGFSGLSSGLPADYFSFPVSSKFTVIDVIGYILLVGSTYVVGPDMYSRILSAKDEKAARSSVLWAALLIIPIAFACAIIGMGAKILFPGIAAEQAFPAVAGSLTPVVGGLILAGLVSATMSSADTCLLSASTIFTVDVVKKFRPQMSERSVLLVARYSLVVIGILSLLLALVLKGIISSLMFAYTIFTCGVIIPVFFGFFKDRLKVTSLGAMAAIIGGGGVALISKLPTVVNVSHVPVISSMVQVYRLDLWSLVVSVVLLFVVSLIDNQVRKPKQDIAVRQKTQ